MMTGGYVFSVSTIGGGGGVTMARSRGGVPWPDPDGGRGTPRQVCGYLPCKGWGISHLDLDEGYPGVPLQPGSQGWDTPPVRTTE